MNVVRFAAWILEADALEADALLRVDDPDWSRRLLLLRRDREVVEQVRHVERVLVHAAQR
jgi:hypothetical protein